MQYFGDLMIDADEQRFYANDFYYLKDDLEFNYHLTDTLYGQVDLDTLNSKTAMIESLLNGNISPRFGSDCNDMGYYTFYAYCWDAYNNRYKSIMIEQTGDECRINSSDATEDISTWMFDLVLEFINPYYGNSCQCGYH